ncbi:MAG: hypothetical protein V8S38_07095 [Lachnospiraceae bacterium]
MARQKKPVHRVQMTDGKRNIIRQLLAKNTIAYPGWERRFKKNRRKPETARKHESKCGDLAGSVGGLHQSGVGHCPSDRSALTIAAPSGRALIRFPLSIWGQPPAQWEEPGMHTGKIRALQESAALFSFLQANGIQSMQQLFS